MPTYHSQRIAYFALAVFFFGVSLTTAQAAASTLARLSFWVPPERTAEFEATYKEKVVPILKRHGLVQSSERGRATVEGIFSRLFEVGTPSEVEEKREALEKDLAWHEILENLETVFWLTEADGRIRYHFGIYSAPAEASKTVPAGRGKVVPAGRGRGHWRTFDVTDGLGTLDVPTIFQDGEGNLWFATDGGGVSQYDGGTFTTFTTANGLASNSVGYILQDRAGNLWFGTRGSGVNRYDGQIITTFTTEDGLGDNDVWTIFQDKNGHLWFATNSGGVSRYDGQNWVTFTTADGLVSNTVLSTFQDEEGHFWFATFGGVSRYDGQNWVTLTTADGLGDNRVLSIFQDRAENLWFGTHGGGVSRYDGETFTTFTTAKGLGHNSVWPMLQDQQGHIWFGTDGGVVSRYDGRVFQTLTRDDGLTGNTIWSLLQDGEGNLWVPTFNGVVRYRQPAPSPPPVFIDAVVVDKRYTGVSSVTIPSTAGLVSFEFHGKSFKTRPEAMVYRYRLRGQGQALPLQGYDKWKNTNDRRVEYLNLPRGNYTFEVLAVDRDLVYSERPAQVTLHIKRPWWQYTLAGIILAGPPLAFGIYQLGRRRQIQLAIAQQFNPYVAGRVVGADMYFGRSDLITEVERTLANNCFLLYGERRIGKTSLQHQLRERLSNADDPTYRFIPAYIDMQGVVEDDFFRTIGTSIVEACRSAGLLPLPPSLPPNFGGAKRGETQRGARKRWHCTSTRKGRATVSATSTAISVPSSTT